ncbi:hypothetical protein AAKU55_000459 [Oxalobacteraceae bacterium GrIS 1.11]
MKINDLKARAWLGMFSFCLMAAAHGQPGAAVAQAATNTSATALEGDYSLASSTTVPAGTWRYTKGRFSVKRLDSRHLLLLFACEWAKSPKEQCSDWWIVQLRDKNLYLQDMNTDDIGMYFDPSTRTLTMTRQGRDAKGSVRTDVFQPDDKALTDQALIRRMKSAQSSFDGTDNAPGFGKHGAWKYTHLITPLPRQ